MRKISVAELNIYQVAAMTEEAVTEEAVTVLVNATGAHGPLWLMMSWQSRLNNDAEAHHHQAPTKPHQPSIPAKLFPSPELPALSIAGSTPQLSLYTSL
jgi:hypothetical protein